MKNIRCYLTGLLLTALLTTILTGCGHSGGQTQPAPPQTGDTTLFPHKELMASPATVTSTQTIVLDARSTQDYIAGHIPGATSSPPSLFTKPGEEEELLPVSEIETILGSMGITLSSKMIIYDNAADSGSPAGRLFWILEYLGCAEVTILNGGWYQWKAQDMAVETTTPPAPSPPPVFTAEIDPTVIIADKAFVADHFLPTPDDDYILIDVRTASEYLNGHIPGAINFPYNECFNSDKTVLNFQELKLLLEKHGILTNKKMVVYSTLGHRSGYFYYLCRLMGYSNVMNYIGSTADWEKANLTDPLAYPIVTGP